MSAEACPKEGCPGVPLMTKAGTSFCANCDQPPDVQRSLPTPSPPGTDLSLKFDEPSLEFETISPPSTPESQEIPPTNPGVPPTPEDLARRAQSDQASRDIADLLLRGYSLLAEECPDCHTPLVRRPRPRPSTDPTSAPTSSRRGFKTSPRPIQALHALDPRKICVTCHREYISEGDIHQLNSMASTSNNLDTDERKKRSREIDTNESISSSKGKSKVATSRVVNLDASTSAHAGSSLNPTIALNRALQALTDQLGVLTQSSHLNPCAVGDTADAMGKVARALSDVHVMAKITTT